MSRFPTGIYLDKLFQISHKYWWLRSPYSHIVAYSNGAWYVRSDGDLVYYLNNVDLSYGHLNSIGYPKFHIEYWWLRSPTMDYDLGAWQVIPSGIVGFSGGRHVTSSYGRI